MDDDMVCVMDWNRCTESECESFSCCPFGGIESEEYAQDVESASV